jgi:hypothetical protein
MNAVDARAMRTHRRLQIFTALTLVELAATIVVHGGWQAAAAGFGIITGSAAAMMFAALRAASERPRSGHASWAERPAAPAPARVAAAPDRVTATLRAPLESPPVQRRPIAPGPPRTA